MATTFPILIKNTGRVHDPDCRKTLSKRAEDQVQWIAAGGGPWTVVFTSSSPFSASSFTVAVGGGATSGPPVNGTVNTSYKYQVRDAGGKVVDDPDILIES